MAATSTAAVRPHLQELQPLCQVLAPYDLRRHALVHVIIIAEQHAVVQGITGLIRVKGLQDL